MFGNTHYNIGKKMLTKIDISLSESEKNAFLSGVVYADIGRFKFDKQSTVASDSDEFVEKMKKHAVTTEEKWFSRGMEMHTLQDKKTSEFLINIFGKSDINYLHYIFECGVVDAYFLNKDNSYIFNEFLSEFNFEQVSSGLDIKSLSKAIGIPNDKVERSCKAILVSDYKSISKDYLVTYDELIMKTYASLGYEVTKEDIHEQEANILGAFFIVCSVAKRQGFSQGTTDKIDGECEKIANFCVAAL